MTIKTSSPSEQPAQTRFIIKPLLRAVSSVFIGSLVISQAYAADNTTSDTSATQTSASEATTADSATSAAATQSATVNSQGESEASLGSVVVTANKREETAQKVPTAITVLGGKELQDKGIGKSAGEVLNYVPNASANTQFNGRPRWWIRGVGSGQQQIDMASPVGIYLDDVYISNATASGFPLFDLDRVEVLRGPQGTLWGKNTTGGAVNIISKKPSFNTGENYVKADIGNYGSRIFEGAVGGEIVSERVAGRLSFYDQSSDGFFRNQFTGQRDGAIKDTAVRGQLLFQLTDNLEALVNVHRRDYTTDGSIQTVIGAGPGGAFRFGYVPSTSRKDVSSNAENSGDSTQNGASLTLKWDLGKYSLTSISAYEDWDQTVLNDADNSALELSRGYTKADSKQYSQEFRFASPREDRWNWLSGVHLFKEDISSYSASARLPNGSVPAFIGTSTNALNNFSFTDYDHKASSVALFGSTTYNWTEAFKTTLGARWSTEKKEVDITRRSASGSGITAASWDNLGQWWNTYIGSYNNPTGLVTNFDAHQEKRWDSFTYDFTPEYKISETSRTFFKFAHGEKSGGFNTAATATAALNTVKPEKLNAYELGYKSEWLNGRLNFNTTLFYYDYKDVQVNVVGLPPGATTTVSYLQNADSATVKGAEFEVEALPTSNLRLIGNIGLQSGEFDKLQVQNSTTNYDGNDLVRTPNLNSLLSASYRIPLANDNKIVTSLDWRYTGQQYYFVNAQNAAQNTYYKLLSQEGYSIVNARVTWSTKGDRLAITGYVNNLFDKEYLAHALPATPATGSTAIYGAPRTAGVSLTLRF